MSRIQRRHLIQSAAALGLPAWGSLALAQTPRAKEPPLPALGSTLRLPPTLSLLDGSAWSADQVQGKVLVIYWWASWCPFCAVQSPHIEALWRAHNAKGLQVLGLSVDKQASAAVNYAKTKGYTFPSAMATPAVQQLLPKPAGLPVVVVLGRNGQVVFGEAGEMFPEDIESFKKYL